MKRNDQFVLEKIEDSIYLLPIGQMIADLNKGIRVNETCQFIYYPFYDPMGYLWKKPQLFHAISKFLSYLTDIILKW